MRKLCEIIKKNLKLLLRSKASALIVILGPLMVIFLLGIAFDNSNLYALNLGIIAPEKTPLTEDFIGRLQAREFSVKELQSQELCIQQIQEGILHACIVFPVGLSIDKKELSNEITFYVDYSKLNLIYVVIETLTSKISLKSEELSVNLTNILLEQLEKTRIEVFSVKPIISELQKSNEVSVKSVTEIKQSSEKLDLVFQGKDIGTEQLKKVLNVRSTDPEFIKSGLERIRTSVDEAKKKAEEKGASDVAFILGGVKADISDLRSNITSIDLNLAVSYIEKIQSNVDLAQTKINAAAKARGESTDNFKTIISELDKTKGDLKKINTAFSNIDGYIGSIQVNKAEDIVNPINTKIKAITSKKTHLNFLFPSLMVLVIMFMAIMLGTTLVMMEKQSPAYFRNFITPVWDITFIFGTFLTSLLLVSIQMAIIIGIAIYYFSAEIMPVLSTVVPILLLIISLFTLLGMIIGYIFNSDETATLAAISISSLMLLISNLIIPIETMPENIKEIAAFNPFIICEQLLKKLIVFQSSPELYQYEMNNLLLYIGIAIVLVVIIQKLTKFNVFKSFWHRCKRLFGGYCENKKIQASIMQSKRIEIVKDELANLSWWGRKKLKWGKIVSILNDEERKEETITRAKSPLQKKRIKQSSSKISGWFSTLKNKFSAQKRKLK